MLILKAEDDLINLKCKIVQICNRSYDYTNVDKGGQTQDVVLDGCLL